MNAKCSFVYHVSKLNIQVYVITAQNTIFNVDIFKVYVLVGKSKNLMTQRHLS